MGDRVVLRAGDALTDDLGQSAIDLILVIGQLLRPDSPRKASQLGAFFDLYFSLLSMPGTWTFDEMRAWQADAGLVPRKPIRLRFAREIGLQVADKVP